MPNEALSALFRAHGRRNRSSGLWILLPTAATWIAIASNTRLALSGQSQMALHDASWPWLTAFLAISLLAIPLLVFLSAQRCHDLGLPSWLLLLGLIPWMGPLLLALLWLTPGTRGENRYGPDPIWREDEALFDMERGP